jgi:hypothetical protein
VRLQCVYSRLCTVVYSRLQSSTVVYSRLQLVVYSRLQLSTVVYSTTTVVSSGQVVSAAHNDDD